MPVEPVVIRPRRAVPAWLFRAWELFAPRVPRWAQRWVGRFFLRFPPGSRPRSWFLTTISMIAWDATARTRFDLVLPIWDPDCEWRWDATGRMLGFDEVYRRHDGVKRSLREFNETWEDRTYTVREILDGGDVLVMRLTIAGRAVRSGIPAEGKASAVLRVDPFIVDWRAFFDDAEALREAGFSPEPPDPS